MYKLKVIFVTYQHYAIILVYQVFKYNPNVLNNFSFIFNIF